MQINAPPIRSVHPAMAGRRFTETTVKRKPPMCHMCMQRGHWTYSCEEVKILSVTKLEWIAELKARNSKLYTRLARENSGRSEIEVFYDSHKEKARRDLERQRAVPMRCHFCPDDGDESQHWTAECPIGNIKNTGIQLWEKRLSMRNAPFADKMNDRNLLGAYYVRCLGRM